MTDPNHATLRRLIVSAPWGNYLHFPRTTPTLGTFTRDRRGGLLWRLWRCLRTLRYDRHQRAWTNRLGLPNPGIAALGPSPGAVVSVYAFGPADWPALFAGAVAAHPLAVELNLSCPNAAGATLDGLDPCLGVANAAGVPVIAKLPPVGWLDLAGPLFDLGVRHFHLCNTLPDKGGGVSGAPLKPFSLRAVEACRKRWGGAVEIIGGGGVACGQDVRDCLSAGADRVAVGSMLLNPLNWRRVPGFVRLLGG